MFIVRILCFVWCLKPKKIYYTTNCSTFFFFFFFEFLNYLQTKKIWSYSPFFLFYLNIYKYFFFVWMSLKIFNYLRKITTKNCFPFKFSSKRSSILISLEYYFRMNAYIQIIWEHTNKSKGFKLVVVCLFFSLKILVK